MKFWKILIFIFTCLELYSQPSQVIETENSITIYINKSKLVPSNNNDTIPCTILFTALKNQEFNIKANNDFEKYEVNYSYLYRGLPIYTLTIAKSRKYEFVDNIVKVVIPFGKNKEIQLSNAKLNNAELSLYSPIINKKHIPAILKNSFSNKNYSIQSNEIWYNKEINYLKLNTKNDGVAVVKISEVLSLLPSIQGLDFKFLHLQYKGNEYPFYYKSFDNLIDNQDKLFFLGRMFHCDSTWLDFYTDESSFFLFYDTSYVNKNNLELIPNLDSQNEVKLVNFKEHYEKDFYYAWVSSVNTETEKNEGWYEKEIRSDYYLKNHILDFSDSPNDSVSFKVRIAITNEAAQNKKSYSQHTLLFNNKILVDGSLFDQEERILSSVLPSNSLINGMNKIQINTPFLNYNGSKDTIQGYTSVDYLEFSGKSKPNAINSKLYLEVDKQNENSFVYVNGFNNANQVYIDSLNNKIGFAKYINSGTLVRIGGIEQNNQSQISLSINDSNYSSDKKGFHLGTFSALNNNYKFKYYQDGNELFNELNTFSKDDMFILIISKNQSLPINLKNKLKSIGSKIIDNVNNNDLFALTKNNDTAQSIYEIKNSININYSNFLLSTNGKSNRAMVEFEKGKDVKIFCNDDSSIELPKISSVKKSDLRNINNQFDLIVITHDSLVNSATEYANFRKEKNNVKVLVVTIDDIYKEFNFGHKSAFAIKTFLKYAFENWSKPSLSFVAIWGDASIDTRKVLDDSKTTDFIPAFGLPASDTWYSTIYSDSDNYISQFVIARIPAFNEKSGYEYLEKIKEYENSEIKPWKKKFLSLTAGFDIVSSNDFYNRSMFYVNELKEKKLCADIVQIKRFDTNYVANSESVRIRNEINSGVIWTSYLGHGAATIFELGGWDASELNNPSKYGILSTVSCNTGSYAEPRIQWAKNEEFVMTPKKGFISAIGSTSTGIVETDVNLLSTVFYFLTSEDYSLKNIGVLLNLAKSKLSGKDQIELGAIYQYSLLGDPMISLNLQIGSDLYIDNSNVTILNENRLSQITENDSLCKIKFNLYNNGFKEQKNFKIIGIHTYNDTQEILIKEIDNVCLYTPIEFDIDIKNKIGDHKFEIVIDSEKVSSDYNRSNNNYIFNFSVFSNALLKLDPQEYWDINPIDPEFRLIDNRVNYENKEYELVINDFNTNEKIATANYLDIEINENYLNWKPKIKLLINRKYILFGRYKDKITQNYSAWIKIPFWTNEKFKINNSTSLLNNFDEDQISKRLFVKIDSINKNLKLTNFELNVSLISVAGNATNTKYNKMEITPLDSINKTIVFVNNPYQDGIHIVVLNSQDRFKLPVYRWFQTAYQLNPKVDTANYPSSRLNQFLKDSIGDDDYVMITCVSFSINMFNFPPIKGDSLQGRDILIRELKRFGAKMADSLNNWPSYCFIGRRSHPNEAIEKYKEYEPVKIDTILKVYDKKGYFVTKNFGPAKKYSKVELESNLSTENVKSTLKIIGIKESNIIDTIITIENSIYSCDLSNIKANEYKYLKFLYEIERLDEKANPIVQSIYVSFIPLDELAIVKSKTYITPDTTERGYDFAIKTSFQNISPRVFTDTVSLNLSFTSNQSTKQNNYSFLNLEPNQIIQIDSIINSTDLDNTNTINYNLKTGYLQREYYKFNNSFKNDFYITNDTIKPFLKFYIDSLNVKPYDYIQQNPTVTIELYDKSPLDLKDSNSIFTRINRFPKRQSNSKLYDLKLFGNKSNLKAKLTIINDTILDFGENVFTVVAKDASGNKADTIDIYLLVSNANEFSNQIQYPNPFIENTNFKFDFKSMQKEVACKVEIYNLTGSKIRTINTNVKLGANTINFDGKLDNGNLIIAGIYYYKIYLDSELFAEPIIGKFVKID